MFDYVKDKEYLSCIRRICGEIMQDLCHILKKDYDIGAVPCLVGSGGRNLITQNANEPVDLDYNLTIVRCDGFGDGKYLKESCRKAFNKALKKHGWGDCQDSTSVLTTEERVLKRGNKTPFKMDVCIVKKDTEGNLRLIHEKTGWICNDSYYWNQAPNSKDIRYKADFIKKSGQWSAVRKQYLDVKNHYLERNDHNHPSFICYIEAVNNVYNTIRQRQQGFFTSYQAGGFSQCFRGLPFKPHE